MKPTLEKIPIYNSSSFAVKYEVGSANQYPWHYHPEYEIAWVESGYGIKYVGDEINSFEEGELMMLGPNIPHVWKYDNIFENGSTEYKSGVYVVHFTTEFLGKEFFQIPELVHINKLLINSERGLVFSGETKKVAVKLLKQIVNSQGGTRICKFIELLNWLGNSTHYESLTSNGFTNSFNQLDSERLEKIYDFALNHYRENINVELVAEKLNMTLTSFCRYFKSRTGRSFKQLVNEIRIGNACRLLIESELNITQICYECGYNNLSYFNRQFRSIKKLTPKEYKSSFKKI